MVGGGPALPYTARALWSSLGIESLGQRRYRSDCDDDAGAEAEDEERVKPLYRQRWLLHGATIWGFLGLMVATSSTRVWPDRHQGDGTPVPSVSGAPARAPSRG